MTSKLLKEHKYSDRTIGLQCSYSELSDLLSVYQNHIRYLRTQLSRLRTSEDDRRVRFEKRIAASEKLADSLADELKAVRREVAIEDEQARTKT